MSSESARLVDRGEQSVEGKVAFVTGANSGLGKVTAMELARRGAHVFLACRSRAKTQPVVDEIKAATGNEQVEFIELDLSSFNSIRRCAREFLERSLPVTLFVLNAGLAGSGVTEDGFEVDFGVNHLGHFLLTHLLLPCVRRGAPARIVVVSSLLHAKAPRLDLDAPGLRRPTSTMTGVSEYGTSKLCNILFANELARRLQEQGAAVMVNSLHPGSVATAVWRRVPACIRCCITRRMLTAERACDRSHASRASQANPAPPACAEGAATQLYLCLSTEVANTTGAYFVNCRAVPPHPQALDSALGAQLWARSCQWTGVPEDAFGAE